MLAEAADGPMMPAFAGRSSDGASTPSSCCTCPQAAAPGSVEAAMRQAITTLPGELFCTITWDQGKEMAYHAQFTIATGIQVYFCDPHKPW
jgi:IS30 family transposase